MNGKLTIANLGDSIGLLVKNSNIIELTSEHNYSRLDEYQRVTNQNSSNFWLFKHGLCYRINGSLNVSRSIGDVKYKPAISSEPELQTISLSSLDEYLILASDGIYSSVSQQILKFSLEIYEESSHWLYDKLSKRRNSKRRYC